MGKCKYCGLSAGLFSHAHKECEEKHKQGVAELQACLHSYFGSTDSIGNVILKIKQLRTDNYLTQDDIDSYCRQGLRRFTDSIRLPITKQYLQKIDEFIHHIGISQTTLNKEGDIDKLGTRLYHGVLMSYFVEQQPMIKVEKRLQLISRLLPITSSMKEEAGLMVLDKAATKFLNDGLISSSEQAMLDNFSNSLNLPTNNLPAKFHGSSIEKIKQAEILRQLQNGITPTARPFSLPIILSQGEQAIWVYDNVTMYQEKITREWVGRYNGISYRVMKGVYYRIGGSKGHPVERSSMEKMGVGILILTNKNICFHTNSRSIKIPYKKLAGMTSYSDGIEIHQDGAKAQRQLFQGFDSWFLMNLLSCINI